MTDDLIKALCLDKFIVFRDTLEMKTTSHYSLKIT